jgi:hypothetical protein
LSVFDIELSFDAASSDDITALSIMKSHTQGGPYYPVASISPESTSYTDHFGDIGSWYAVSEVVSGVNFGRLRDHQRGNTLLMNLLVDSVRREATDPKAVFTPIAREQIGTATGTGQEAFYPEYTPMAGWGHALWVGRHFYEPIVHSGYRNPLRRQYIFDIEQSQFLVCGQNRTSGIVYANYIWSEPKSYRFSDYELKLFLKDASDDLNMLYGSSIEVSGSGPSMNFSRTLTAFESRILVLLASSRALKSLQDTLTGQAIIVRDGPTMIDTTKALKDRSSIIRDIDVRVKTLINNQFLEDQLNELVQENVRIDTYSTSTSSQGLYSIGAYYEVNKVEDRLIMPGYGATGSSGRIQY